MLTNFLPKVFLRVHLSLYPPWFAIRTFCCRACEEPLCGFRHRQQARARRPVHLATCTHIKGKDLTVENAVLWVVRGVSCRLWMVLQTSRHFLSNLVIFSAEHRTLQIFEVGTEKGPQRTCVTKMLPKSCVNFLSQLASKPLFWWVVTSNCSEISVVLFVVFVSLFLAPDWKLSEGLLQTRPFLWRIRGRPLCNEGRTNVKGGIADNWETEPVKKWVGG